MPRPEGGRSAADPRPRVALVVSSLVLVVVTADVVLGGPLASLDVQVTRVCRGIARGSAAGRAVEPLTLFGAWAPVLAVQAAYGGWITARHRTVRPLARLAVLALMLAGSVVAAKAGFGRVPPYIPDALWSGGRSYPSGHTATAVALWGLGASVAADWCGARTRRLTRTVSVLAPALTGTAMVLLCYHWLTDVVAGAAIGVLLLAVLRGVDRVVLAHLPGADRGIARAGDHDGGRLVAARGACGGGDRRRVHDPRPADR